MDIGWGNIGISDQVVLAAGGAVVEIEEPFGLALAHHIATVRIRRTFFDLLDPGRFRFRLQRLLAVVLAILIDRCLQLGQVAAGRCFNMLLLQLVLVGADLEVSGVGIKNTAIDPLLAHRLQHDLGKDLLINHTLGKATTTVLAKRRCIGNLVGQPIADKLAIGHIDLDLPNQLPFGANAEQVTEKQHLKQHHRIHCRTTVVGAIEIFDFLADKLKVDNSVDFAQQVIFGNQFFDADEFHPNLLVVMFS